MLTHSLLCLGAASLVAATKVLVPLYSWNEDCWPELQQAAYVRRSFLAERQADQLAPLASAANPSVEWVLIVNPNSGPTSDVTDPSLYCVPTLREKVPRSTIVGYVRTDYGKTPKAEVSANVATYASWKGIKVGTMGKSAQLDGIFFDETADLTTKALENLYSGYSATTRKAFPGASTVSLFDHKQILSHAHFRCGADRHEPGHQGERENVQIRRLCRLFRDVLEGLEVRFPSRSSSRALCCTPR